MNFQKWELFSGSHMFYNYRFSTPNHSHKVTGTVYAEFVYTFLVQHENHIFYNFRFSTPNDSHKVTGTVYTECVYTVPVAT